MTDAAGKWEAPGGHLEDGETSVQAAVREWREETGLDLPAGEFTGTWTSATGIYTGHVYTIASEDLLPVLTGRDLSANPDDPDGDSVEALAWWSSDLLAGNPAVRAELLADVDAVITAIGRPTPVEPAQPVTKADLDALVMSARRVDAARDALVKQSVPQVTVNVPTQPAPVVHVAAPQVTVAAPNVAAPQVDVHVAAPNVTVEPPDVTVTPQIDVHIPVPSATRNVKREPDGSITVKTG